MPGIETLGPVSVDIGTLGSVYEAEAALAGLTCPSPVRDAPRLSQRFGLPIRLKLENTQPTGSFKIRPALLGLQRNLRAARERGVIASSSGNFAKAVAWASQLYQVHVEIVMQADADCGKIAAAEALGARVVRCGPAYEERLTITLDRQRASGRVLLHSSDSIDTVTANAVIGIEIVREIGGEHVVLVPVSGGGLLAGVAWSVKSLQPCWDVVGVQAAANPSMAASLAHGTPVSVASRRTIADALRVTRPSAVPFGYVQRFASGVELVEESHFIAAMALLEDEEGVVAEPAGAAGIALLESGWRPRVGQAVVAVISGGME